MAWPAIIAGISTGLSAFGTMQSKRYRAGEQINQAAFTENNAELIKVRALEDGLAMDTQFKNDMSKNTNFLMAQSGRSYDPSIDAFLKSEKDIYATNKKRASVQSYLEHLSQKAESASLRSQAKNTIKSATVGAVSTLLKGGIAYYDTRGKGTN